MNWDAIIAITEIVGVILIIASLIYVGRQIKQNSAIARSNVIHGTAESYSRFFELLAEDADLAEIFRRGTEGEELNAAEVIRYTSLLEVYFSQLEDIDHQYKSDLYFDEEDNTDIVVYMAPQFRPFLESPVGRMWWTNGYMRVAAPSFAAKINKLIDDWDEKRIPTLQPETDAVAKDSETEDEA